MIEDQIEKLHLLAIDISKFKNRMEMIIYRIEQFTNLLDDASELLNNKIIDEEIYIKIVDYVKTIFNELRKEVENIPEGEING